MNEVTLITFYLDTSSPDTTILCCLLRCRKRDKCFLHMYVMFMFLCTCPSLLLSSSSFSSLLVNSTTQYANKRLIDNSRGDKAQDGRHQQSGWGVWRGVQRVGCGGGWGVG